MKLFLVSLTAWVTFISSSFAMDCRQVYGYRKASVRYSEHVVKTNDGSNSLPVGGLLAVSSAIVVASTTNSAGLVLGAFVAGGLAPAGVSVGISSLKNIKPNKMIKLIDQAYANQMTGGKEVGSLLNRLHKKIDDRLTVDQLATAIVQANESGNLCLGRLIKFSKMDDAVRSGQVRVFTDLE